MRPVRRRTALTLGGAGTAVALTGTADLLWGSGAGFQPSGGREISEPEVLRSSDTAMRRH
ncbi:hypothetical protein BJQ90_01139 [Arthrobacter sp. SO3]|nr:hypothetical protein [Arthrobacter sp. SO3]